MHLETPPPPGKQKQAVLVLVQAGADKYIENNKGETPLHLELSEPVKAALHAQAAPSQPPSHASDDESQQRPNPTAAAADQNQGSLGRQEGGQEQKECGDVESTADAGESEPMSSAGIAGTASAGAGGVSVAGLESVVTQPAAVVVDGVGGLPTAGDDVAEAGVVGDGEAIGAGSEAAGGETEGQDGEKAQSGMSLAERRRKKRKLMEGGGGVSLSHSGGDGKEVEGEEANGLERLE